MDAHSHSFVNNALGKVLVRVLTPISALHLPWKLPPPPDGGRPMQLPDGIYNMIVRLLLTLNRKLLRIKTLQSVQGIVARDGIEKVVILFA